MSNKKPSQVTFGHRLAVAIRRSRYSKKTVADHLGVSPSIVSQWCDDLKKPDFNNLCRLILFLDVKADWLLFDSERETVDSRLMLASQSMSPTSRRALVSFLETLR
ncbi:helix-turn-helix domain-containing protein [Endozoicomonas gorgoniicola]|uniref:Helix-turn-helix domain-containing protein n=1 Tax=Endozoicomonas gorgoniicola TaxID=1234144 RepID=A0ABT3N1K4_9GAMM|nr:helix-turn-helix transcriptional regulator [Endozoicomonas gorgoniicola]MCW7555515.1 helix-turn-helix domain-containing protein [Endozoicomonas gorgoniicola]